MATTRNATRVHDAELSTDRDAYGGYAETLALLVAIAVVALCAWAVAAPRTDADLALPTSTVAGPSTFTDPAAGDAAQPTLGTSAATTIEVGPSPAPALAPTVG